MHVQQTDAITGQFMHELVDNRDRILVVRELELPSSLKPSRDILAAAVLPSLIDPVGEAVKISFHHGRGAWHLVTEYMSIQKATQFEAGTLPEIIERFESRCETKLPDIKVVHLGVGVYPAASRYITDNPWAMQDGEQYEFTDRRGETRRYIASVRDGTTTIARVVDGEDYVFEAYDPRVILGATEWRTMRHVRAEEMTPVPRKTLAGSRP